MNGFEEYCSSRKPILSQAVDRTLRELFQDLHVPLDETFRGLFQDGKLIRGSLVCLVNESLGGDLSSAIPRSVAVEMIHGATLIHDDFVDQDRTRRGKPAGWTLTGAAGRALGGRHLCVRHRDDERSGPG